jgi:hypothetical protein
MQSFTQEKRRTSSGALTSSSDGGSGRNTSLQAVVAASEASVGGQANVGEMHNIVFHIKTRVAVKWMY